MNILWWTLFSQLELVNKYAIIPIEANIILNNNISSLRMHRKFPKSIYGSLNSHRYSVFGLLDHGFTSADSISLVVLWAADLVACSSSRWGRALPAEPVGLNVAPPPPVVLQKDEGLRPLGFQVLPPLAINQRVPEQYLFFFPSKRQIYFKENKLIIS